MDDLCTGHGPDCPGDLFEEVGSPCSDDGYECTNDACDGEGQCEHSEINGCRDIPTVSTWGLLILSLLFIVGAKLRFRLLGSATS